ncbi:MAG TPA: FliA/WhiG family RNA polymerase sigma factor [Armatimonadota bacterium]|nr:FliA/WhiG family RNA polymerase sigma factor [Armatimonadota bacterium]
MLKMDEIWRRCKQDSDPDARQHIISNYAYLAKYVVDRLNLCPNPVVSYDDLIGHAIMGLIDAVDKFDPNREVKFETYASVRIRGAVLDALKSLDWMPRSVRATEQELKRVYAALEAELGRPATDEETARALGIDVDELQDTLADVGQSAILSLEDIMATGEETGNLTGLGISQSSFGDPELVAIRAERKRLLAQAIAELPEKEKLVISLYYKEGLTLKEVAAVLEVTESRACQLHSKAVLRLQGKLARHKELLTVAA